MDAISQRFSPQLPASLLSRGSDLAGESPRTGGGSATASYRRGAAEPLLGASPGEAISGDAAAFRQPALAPWDAGQPAGGLAEKGVRGGGVDTDMERQ